MNKTLENILKIAGALLAVAALVFAVISYWDQISAFAQKVMGKLRNKCCPEYSYYAEEDADLNYFAD